MTCRPVSHPGVLWKARPGGGRPPLPRPRVDPGPGPGSGPLTRCRPRCGCISGPGSGWQGDSACAPWRAPWRSACSRKGWSRSTCPSAAWCLRATITCVRAGRPAGLGGPPPSGVGTGCKGLLLTQCRVGAVLVLLGAAHRRTTWERGQLQGGLPGPGPAPPDPSSAPQPLTRHMHHSAAALPNHVSRLAGQATPR